MFFFVQEFKTELLSKYPTADVGKVEQLLSSGYALLSEESKSIGLPDFPLDNLQYAAKILVGSFYKFLSST